jgi:hypothetical protein
MKAQIEKNQSNLKVIIDCTAEELLLLGESLQQALDERSQKFGTHLVRAAQKHLEA